MHALGATATPRAPLFSARRPGSASAPPHKHSTTRWHPTRRISSCGAFELLRAAAPGDLGPGCYVLKTCNFANDVAPALLRREALVSSQVIHTNLVTVLAAVWDAPMPHLVLPYLEGITLRKLLDSSPVLPVSFSLSIVRQIAGALAFLHAGGWLHGQIRPEHIIISPQGHATLIDLTRSSRLESSECDATCTIPSTLTYAAPERALSHSRLTAAADAYSLGIVLYEAIAGQPPFRASSPRELMHSHFRDAPPDLRQLRANTSLEVAEACRRLLAKEPLRRPAISQVVRWLTELEIAELAS